MHNDLCAGAQHQGQVLQHREGRVCSRRQVPLGAVGDASAEPSLRALLPHQVRACRSVPSPPARAWVHCGEGGLGAQTPRSSAALAPGGHAGSSASSRTPSTSAAPRRPAAATARAWTTSSWRARPAPSASEDRTQRPPPPAICPRLRLGGSMLRAAHPPYIVVLPHNWLLRASDHA